MTERIKGLTVFLFAAVCSAPLFANIKYTHPMPSEAIDTSLRDEETIFNVPTYNKRVCESVVCNEHHPQEEVAAVGDFPKREHNSNLDAVTSVIYALGEIGLAEGDHEQDEFGDYEIERCNNNQESTLPIVHC